MSRRVDITMSNANSYAIGLFLFGEVDRTLYTEIKSKLKAPIDRLRANIAVHPRTVWER